MKIAQSNVRVLQELQQCTDKLEVFNLYLSDIEGYTAAIHRFETLFNVEAGRIHILEEIRDFFGRHKGEIVKTTADADNAIRESLSRIKESTSSNVDELHAHFVQQSEAFKEILKAERDAFELFISDLKVQFSNQMNQMPLLAKQLEEIASIPDRLDQLIEKVEKSNARLVNDISQSFKSTLIQAKVNNQLSNGEAHSISNGNNMPSWMRLSGWAALLIIAITCIINIVLIFFPINGNQLLREYVQSTEIVPIKPNVEESTFKEDTTSIINKNLVKAQNNH